MQSRGDACGLAHRRAGAVGGHQQPGLDAPARSQPCPNPILLDLEGFDPLGAVFGQACSAAFLLQPMAQLTRDHNRADSLDVQFGGTQADMAEAAFATDFDAANRALRQGFVADTEPGQDIERGAVDDEGPVVVAWLLLGAAGHCLDHRDIEAGLGQSDAEAGAGQPAADDQDVVTGVDRAHARINASISSATTGTSALRISGAVSVTRTSSSMRMPML